VYPGKENYARAWNTNHLTRTNMSMALMLPWPNNFLTDRAMYCLIDNLVEGGRNRMWVIAE
jgi:hypothetical protein